MTWEGSQPPGTFCELSGNYCGITVGDLNKPPHPSCPPPHFFYCGTSREQAGQLGNKDPILGICSLQPYPLHSQPLNVCPKETLPAHCAATRAGAAPWHPVGKGESVTHHLKLKSHLITITLPVRLRRPCPPSPPPYILSILLFKVREHLGLEEEWGEGGQWERTFEIFPRKPKNKPTGEKNSCYI